MRTKSFLFTLPAIAVSLAFALVAPAKPTAAGFSPPPGKVLVFVGQDNQSVGGTAKYREGYVDTVGVPAGITHYVYFSEGWTSPSGHTFATGSVSGLNREVEWKAGPMCLLDYVESPALSACLFQISISMEGGAESRVADGSRDHLIAELTQFLKANPDRFFLLRIGYEFDGLWNHYQPEGFRAAFRRIVDHLRAARVVNFQTIMASSGTEKSAEKWEEYWPGDDYVNWVGYSYFNSKAGAVALAVARKRNLPVFIAEATPRGFFLDRIDGELAWEKWYRPFFAHIRENLDVIRAISYINCNWNAQPMWRDRGWGNSRLQDNAYVRKNWLLQMRDPSFLNASDQPMQYVSRAGTVAAKSSRISP